MENYLSILRRNMENYLFILCRNMFIWRTKKNDPLILIKCPTYLLLKFTVNWGLKVVRSTDLQMQMSHIIRKPFIKYANNKGADQPAYLRSLISAS